MTGSPFAPRAFLGGAVTAFLSAGMGLAGALALRWLLDWSKGGTSAVATVFAVAGFVLGGFRAGLLQPTAPLSNGALAGCIAGVPLAVLQRLFNGKPVNVLSILFVALLSASFGIFGGIVSNTANRNRGVTR